MAARGCKWLPVTRECWRPLAATCGHLRPLEWLQVAASGCKWLPFPKSNYAPPACSMYTYIYSFHVASRYQRAMGLGLPWRPSMQHLEPGETRSTAWRPESHPSRGRSMGVSLSTPGGVGNKSSWEICSWGSRWSA